MGTLTFHPWPVRRSDVDRPDELRIDLDPQPGTDFADAARVARVARDLLDELGLWSASPRPAATAACTSTCGSSPAGSSSTYGTRPSRSGASWLVVPDGVTVTWWKEERGEPSSSTSTRTHATARSPAPTPCGRSRAPRSPHRSSGTSWTASTRGPSTCTRSRPGLRNAATPMADDRRSPGSLESLLQMYDDDIASGLTGHALPARLPEDAGGAAEGAAEQEEPRQLGDRRQLTPTAGRDNGIKHYSGRWSHCGLSRTT